jgi:predicted outer membrane lipoprotein
VNLLSVGLHSYGFIDGIAWGLGLFCAAEIVIIGALWLAAFMQKRREPSKAKDAAL